MISRLGNRHYQQEQYPTAKIKDIDQQIIRDEVAKTKLCMDSPNALDDLVECYNSTLASFLDRHAPRLNRRFKIRPLLPWFNNDIEHARKERRKSREKMTSNWQCF